MRAVDSSLHRMFSREFLRVCFLLPIVVAGSLLCVGQSASGSSATTPSSHPIPLHHRYAYFLRYQIHLDKKADALDQQGYPDKAAEVRHHLQKDMNFTDDQIAILRKAGSQMQDDLQSLRNQAIPIISQDRQWGKVHGRKSGPPPGADQVHELQKEHEAVLLSTMEKINQQLGHEPAARLQAYVNAHVTGHTTHIPSHKLKIGTPPFHWEVR